MPPTDAQLWNIAEDISDCWYKIGVQIGLEKQVLERIEVDYAPHADRQSFQMLYMAREKPIFTTCAELAKLLYNTERPYVNTCMRS